MFNVALFGAGRIGKVHARAVGSGGMKPQALLDGPGNATKTLLLPH